MTLYNNPNQAQAETPKNIVWIIWIALLASQFIYLGVLFYMGKLKVTPVNDMTYIGAMGAMALSILGISEFFWQKTKEQKSSDPSKTSVYTPEKFTNSIIAWALGESIAIYGLVLGFLEKAEPNIIYSFFALALALHIYRKPN